MTFESWWLIFLPLLFGLGWLAARIDFRHMLSESRNLPDSYFKGLNFLLNEQPDRAIDAFVEVAKLDPETTELHFALGNLFRRRGEMERAIRVHQSLLARADLPSRDREHALNEIAQDYLKAGMLDRAEMAYKELKNTRYQQQAARALVRIYESEHDWPKAIEAVRKLSKLTNESVPQLVHYHCEIAQTHLLRQPPEFEAARKALDEAGNSVAQENESTPASRARVLMLEAALARAGGDAKLERHYLLTLLDEAPSFAGLIASDLQNNFAASEECAQLLERLSGHYQEHPSLDLFDVVFRLTWREQGAHAAWAFAQAALTAHPSLLGLERALAAQARAQQDDQASLQSNDGLVSLDLLKRLVGRHTQRLDRYSCRVCGFQARAFYWQCPGCHGWETYSPRRVEEQQ
ncbi:MAG: lipopolysaccharide assembly protein LapB [Burkholderiaceae bacterium]|nr:lipopolysaccharide assembly protein LapB [Burkholderiaceae bacterium]MCD8517981.1 lipopolysaccharide assembly protein LapB [Burkholderiaceae bacterium]MCD8537126.1 lipopolysaccharide assembly protein LapB [Burkholderiaceae bacterium]MCD8564857.1 lipopolysaccharide assembly protein LapB [Burkholderiaceae bacterium]